MPDPTILFVKPKAIKQSDKKALQSAGVIVIEIADVNDAKFIRAGAELSGGDLLRAAAKAIKESGYDDVRIKFARAVCAAVELEIENA